MVSHPQFSKALPELDMDTPLGAEELHAMMKQEGVSDLGILSGLTVDDTHSLEDGDADFFACTPVFYPKGSKRSKGEKK